MDAQITAEATIPWAVLVIADVFKSLYYTPYQ